MKPKPRGEKNLVNIAVSSNSWKYTKLTAKQISLLNPKGLLHSLFISPPFVTDTELKTTSSSSSSACIRIFPRYRQNRRKRDGIIIYKIIIIIAVNSIFIIIDISFEDNIRFRFIILLQMAY